MHSGGPVPANTIRDETRREIMRHEVEIGAGCRTNGRWTIGDFALAFLYAAILYASFVHDLFRIAGPLHACVIGYDSHHVLDRLDAAANGAAAWHPLSPNYLSQFGLQGIVLAAIAPASRLDLFTYSFAAASAMALLFCVGLGAFFVSAGRYVGRLAGHIAVGLTACSLIWMSFAPSLYWAAVLLPLPFQIVWFLEPLCATNRRLLLGLLPAVGLAVMLKCLCGYEYVTSVILAPVAALAFHRVRRGEFGWSFLKPATGLVLAGILGFAAALTIHSRQISALTGQSGWESIANRARERTVEIGNPAGENQIELQPFGPLKSLDPRTAYAIHAFLRYFAMPPIALPMGLTARSFIPLYWFVVLTFALLIAGRVGWLSTDGRALAAATLVGLGASVSWQILAVNHMAVHFHLNMVVFQLPFLLLAFLSIGWLIAQLAAFIRVERLAPVAIGCAAILLAMTNVVKTGNAAIAQQSQTQAAFRAVTTRLSSERPAEPFDAAALRCSTVARPALDWGFEWQTSRAGRSAVPFIETCEIRGPAAVADDPARAIAMASDGTLSACEVSRESMPAGSKSFLIRVPMTMLRRDPGMRLFLVAGRGEPLVAELPLPRDLVAVTNGK